MMLFEGKGRTVFAAIFLRMKKFFSSKYFKMRNDLLANEIFCELIIAQRWTLLIDI